MADRRASLMDPRIEQLMAKVDSKFTLVTLAAMHGSRRWATLDARRTS